MFNASKEFIIDEWKFLVCMIVFYIVCTFPVNYYIVVGGGLSDVGERISVDEQYDSKGSFNLTYVSELKGTILTYGLSYLFPSWDRENMNDYKYSESESYDDIEYRGELDLNSTNSNAVKVAYTLANKEYNEISSKIYVIAVFDEYETEFMIKDELLSIDGRKFATIEEYSSYVQKFEVGEEVKIKVLRDGKEKEINCKLYKEGDRKIFGVSLQVYKEYETNPKVDIKFNSGESGPSGGLITALEIYDKLVKKDITNGLVVAGTGTIDSLGNVGTIGGVRYKIMGAASGDADVFLVPSGENYEEAVRVKKEKKLDIEVIEVSTVYDAIYKLEEINNK